MTIKRVTWEEWINREHDSFWYQDGFKAAAESGFNANSEYIDSLEVENKRLWIKRCKVCECWDHQETIAKLEAENKRLKNNLEGEKRAFKEVRDHCFKYEEGFNKDQKTIAKLKEALEYYAAFVAGINSEPAITALRDAFPKGGE